MQVHARSMSPFLRLLLSVLLLFCTGKAQGSTCKTTPNDASWPSLSQWTALNTSLSGRLISPNPPAAACHSASAPAGACASIAAAWSKYSFHQNDPVSTALNNMNNDTCLPTPGTPCSGLGYPVYVVNATTARHVQLAINFAKRYNIRLGVKASGHDFMHRTSAPFSLSIWTRYMAGNYTFHNSFQPKGCGVTIGTTAVTAGAASYVADIYSALDKVGQTVVDGLGPEVTIGGYSTGGGHGPLSHIYGLGSDQVYEVQMVTPAGQIITANECQNTDLFWAVRGGGGGTFGVLTQVTVRTFPTPRMATYDLKILTQPNSTAYWDIVTRLLAQYPTIAAQNVSAYTFLYPSTSSAGKQVGSAEAIFALPNPTSAAQLQSMLSSFVSYVKTTYGSNVTVSATPASFPSLYGMFQRFADNTGSGVDKVLGSRLLPADSLTANGFTNALQTFVGASGAQLDMVAGSGVQNAQPRGGSDAVNPAWRNALIHAITSQTWTPLDEVQRDAVEYQINNIQTEALRQFVPNSGAYVNEANVNEPNFQQAFFGSNYDRLLQIKKTVDPNNLFWCSVCVGSEGWQEVGDNLCQV